MTTAPRPLTPSLEDYLEAVYGLCPEGGAARSCRVGEALKVSKPSVNAAMRELAARGLVLKERYGALRLSPSGRRAGAEIAGRHALLKDFFVAILGLDEAAAEKDACRAEHALSREALRRLGAFAVFMKRPSRAGLLAKARKEAV